MPANVETCFLYKTPAWHGLGTVVQEAPDSLTALKLAGLDWDVIPEKVYLADGTEIPEMRVNVRSSDRMVLGNTSEKYKIVLNRDAFAFTDELVKSKKAKVTYESAGALNHGRRIWILAHLPAEKILGEEIVPYLVFTNSFDGSQAITAALTPTRVVCQNTLNIALREAKRSWSIRHMGDIEGKKKDAAMTLGLTFDYMKEMNEVAEKYQQTKINKNKFGAILEMVFPVEEKDSDRQRNNALALRQQVSDIYAEAQDLRKFAGDAWGVYNAFADFASHAEPLRITQTFQEKRFASFIDGNRILKQAQEAIEKVAVLVR
jgi:phage/plasmid-like protein (TIGR03299 family)